jgi:hypothetical protein
MNFIDNVEGPRVELELKYCERCGGLFLRPFAASETSCGLCKARLAVLLSHDAVDTVARRIRRKMKLARLNRLGGRPSRIEYLQGVATAEVQPC